MSTNPRTTNEPTTTDRTARIGDHAALRYRQRIDAAEPFDAIASYSFPASRLGAIDDEAGGELEAWL